MGGETSEERDEAIIPVISPQILKSTRFLIFTKHKRKLEKVWFFLMGKERSTRILQNFSKEHIEAQRGYEPGSKRGVLEGLQNLQLKLSTVFTTERISRLLLQSIGNSKVLDFFTKIERVAPRLHRILKKLRWRYEELVEV
jgi:hypothetical protein